MSIDEMNDIFNKNINIAYKIANKYRINYPNEYEDIKQIALLGLWEAIKIYNPKWSLTTIAYKVIFNDINYYLRSVKKHNNNDFSINTVVFDDKEQPLTIEDQLAVEGDFTEEILSDIVIQQTLDRFEFKETEKKILYLRTHGKTQSEIGNILNTSQSQVSRILKRMYKRLKSDLEVSYESYEPKKEEPKMIHKLYINESNNYKNEIELFCPETSEENEEFNSRINDMIEKINLMGYFQGIQ